jgi:hypothetical protein
MSGVNPGLLDRIEKTCCITGCNDKGIYQPMFRVRDPRTSELEINAPLEFFMQCTVCETHRRYLTIHAALTDNLWKHIADTFKSVRGVEPQHKDVTLEFKSEAGLITIFGKRFENEHEES